MDNKNKLIPGNSGITFAGAGAAVGTASATIAETALTIAPGEAGILKYTIGATQRQQAKTHFSKENRIDKRTFAISELSCRKRNKYSAYKQRHHCFTDFVAKRLSSKLRRLYNNILTKG